MPNNLLALQIDSDCKIIITETLFLCRLVYKWFYFIYKLSYALGIIGYILVLFTFFGLNIILNVKPHVWMDWGMLFLFYGLYFGVLGRDVAEICADTMASHIGVCVRDVKYRVTYIL